PLIARPRPYVADPMSLVVGYHPTTLSFPSGHAALSMAAACVMAHAHRRGPALRRSPQVTGCRRPPDNTEGPVRACGVVDGRCVRDGARPATRACVALSAGGRDRLFAHLYRRALPARCGGRLAGGAWRRHGRDGPAAGGF